MFFVTVGIVDMVKFLVWRLLSNVFRRSLSVLVMLFVFLVKLQGVCGEVMAVYRSCNVGKKTGTCLSLGHFYTI